MFGFGKKKDCCDDSIKNRISELEEESNDRKFSESLEKYHTIRLTLSLSEESTKKFSNRIDRCLSSGFVLDNSAIVFRKSIYSFLSTSFYNDITLYFVKPTPDIVKKKTTKKKPKRKTAKKKGKK